jgi:hypothetical protein
MPVKGRFIATCAVAAPVPEDYARRFDEQSPTDYDQYVAFTGPYMVANDPKTGKVTGRDPGKRIEIVRKPELGQVDGLPRGVPRLGSPRGARSAARG